MSDKRYLGNIITPNPTEPAESFEDSAASGTWSLQEVFNYVKAGLWPTAGNQRPPVIEDVFSTYLYTGTYDGVEHTYNTGLDMLNEGGMIWFKSRSAAQVGRILDTERGTLPSLIPSSTAAQNNLGADGLSYTDNGFSIGWTGGDIDQAYDYASWSFRKAPRFFDVVTFTVGASGSDTIINHNLGVTPGFVITKMTNTSSSWFAFHTSTPNQYLQFNATEPAKSWTWTSDETSIDIGAFWSTAYAGNTGIAYFFAHDPLGESGDGSDGMIACGSMATGNDTVELGWEPQWLLFKRTDNTGSWWMVDNMRGLVTGGNDQYLLAESSNAEGSINVAEATATGFKGYFGSGSYVYIAIRRGPMRQPTSGTEVFAVDLGQGANTPAFSSGFPVDFALQRNALDISGSIKALDRLRGANQLLTPSTDAETANTDAVFDSNIGFWQGQGYSISNAISWMFRRAPGFFDVVTSNDTSGAAFTVNHNLGVEPELIITKQRDGATAWWTYPRPLSSSFDKYLRLNDVNAANTSAADITGYTDSTITFGQYFSNRSMVFYLFATLPGVSKVGSYTGNGTSQTIDCGFTSGARFILIKRTDSTGDWYVWDTARGIVAANDPHLSLNTTAAEVTTDDSVDPDNSGFIVNQDAATNVNVSSASYIFLAIA